MNGDYVVNRIVFNHNDLIKYNKIVIFVKPHCQWSHKVYQDCLSYGIIGSLKIVNIDHPQGKKIALDYLKQEPYSIPVWHSVTTGKTSYGYKPIATSINEIITPLYSCI